jgi:hypothetical protein
MKRIWTVTFSLVLTLGLFACGAEESTPYEGPTEPQVVALEHSSLVVGQPVSIYGVNFLEPGMGQTKLIFSGKFYPDGAEIPLAVAEFTIAPLYDGFMPDGGELKGNTLAAMTHVVRWNRFGPFQNPFTKEGNQPGLFQGAVRPVNYNSDGTIEEGQPTPVEIQVNPSLIITKLEPIVGVDENGMAKTAGCDSPALRGIGGMPYIIEVEAMGFQPDYFIYNVSNINGSKEWASFTHPADNGLKDRLGDPGWHPGEPFIVLNPVGDGAEYAHTAIRVTAVEVGGGENGEDKAYHTALPFSVVRSMHYYYDGNRVLAEYYEPEVVHPPIVGGIATSVTYSETHAESRQNAVTVSVSNSWTKSQNKLQTSNWNEGVATSSNQSSTNSVGIAHSEGENSSETYGTSYGTAQGTSSSFSSSSGSNWGWNAVEGTSQEEFDQELVGINGSVSGSVTTTVSGEGSIPGLAKVGGSVGTTVGAEVGAKKDNTVGHREGSKSEHGTHMYESDDETTGYGSTTTDTASKNMSGTYGLQKQSTINQTTSETAGSSESVTYNLGGSIGMNEGVTEGSTESWSETWVTSTTDTKLLSYSSKVPKNRCAVIYRQTVRYVRQAQVYSYDLCGVRSLVGEAVFNEWLWSPNIVTGIHCEQKMPESTQPPAHCYLACE